MKEAAASLIFLILMCLPVFPLQADSDPVASLPGTDFVFYAPDHPRLFRFITTINGRPVAEHETQVLSDLFRMLDKDADGILSNQERVLLPSPRTLTTLGISSSPRASSRQLLQQGPRSSVKTKVDLQSYIHWLGLDSLTLNHPLPATFPETPPAGHLLFQALDVDHDDRLASVELEMAAYNLRKLDLNGDEIWTVQELILSNPPTTGSSRREATPAILIPVSTLRSQQFGMECLRRYRTGSPDSHAPTGDIADKPLPTDIAPLDQDKDGKLSADEWARLLDPIVPDRIFMIRMQSGSASSDAARLMVLDAHGNKTDEVRGSRADLKFPPSQLLLRTEDHAATPDESKLKKIFEQLDRDKNDYIDRNEANRLRGVDFFEIDIDQDGKVFWEEYAAGIKPLFLMMTLKTRIDIDESGFDLFTAVNISHAPGLTLRELKNLPKFMERWDRNHDGEIARQELPKNFNLSLTRGLGLNQLSPSRSSGTVIESSTDAAQRQYPYPEKPAWFTNMDRNHDGDLSSHEFLGDAQTFERFDANHDGLIDRKEAQTSQ